MEQILKRRKCGQAGKSQDSEVRQAATFGLSVTLGEPAEVLEYCEKLRMIPSAWVKNTFIEHLRDGSNE